MKVAVIGNSHGLAIKAAYEMRDKPSQCELTFYYVVGDWQIDEFGAGARLINLKPQSGDNGIELAEYDCYVISAAGWWAARNQYAEIPHPTHPLGHLALSEWCCSPAHVPNTVRVVSEAVFRATIAGWIKSQPITRLVKYIAERYGRPILVQPWPAPSRKLSIDHDWFLNRWYGSKGPIAWKDYFHAQFCCLHDEFDVIGPNLKILEYPLPGPNIDGFMDAAWCEQDPFHGNVEYGNLILNQIYLELQDFL